MATLLAIVFVTLAVSFFCSICEAAFYTVSRGRVEQLAQSGSAGGERLRKLRQNIDRPIAAILTLNTISNTVGATLAGFVAAELFGSLGMGVFSTLFTLGILYISEIIPKTIGVLYADVLGPILALPIHWMISGLWPLVWVCQKITKLFPRSAESAEASEEHLLALARLGLRTGSLRPDEARWMQNALKLDTLKVADILTPRTVVSSIEKDTALPEASQIAARWPHSRVPITDGADLDNIVGVVMRRDVHEAVVSGESDRKLTDIMRKPIFVPEVMTVSNLLGKFLAERQHLFVVADEYGGTAGVVTLEDAIEALLGTEIVDESDRDSDLQRVARRKAAQKLEEQLRHTPKRDVPVQGRPSDESKDG